MMMLGNKSLLSVSVPDHNLSAGASVILVNKEAVLAAAFIELKWYLASPVPGVIKFWRASSQFIDSPQTGHSTVTRP